MVLRQPGSRPGLVELSRRILDCAPRAVLFRTRAMQVAPQGLGGLGDLIAFRVELPGPGIELEQLAVRAVALELQLAYAVAQRAEGLLRLLEQAARLVNRSARGCFVGGALPQPFLGERHLALERRAFVAGSRQLAVEAGARRLPLVAFIFSALAPSLRVAMPFLGHRDAGAEGLDAVAEGGHLVRHLVAMCLGRGTPVVGVVPRTFGLAHRPFEGRDRLAQRLDLCLQLLQLVAPGLHVAGGECELDDESSRGQVLVTFGALALAGQRPHLALDLVDQVIEPGDVVCGLLEAPLGAAASFPIEADAGGFLEQFAPFVRAIRQERVDHALLDHDTGIGAEAGAAHEIVDVAQPAGRPVEEVVALPGAGQPARDHHLTERHRKPATAVLEDERDLRHIHRPSGRGALEDHLFHLGAPQDARALFPQHPAHGIGHIRLSAPVRSDDGGDALVEEHHGRVGERLEAQHLELGQTHGSHTPDSPGKSRVGVQTQMRDARSRVAPISGVVGQYCVAAPESTA